MKTTARLLLVALCFTAAGLRAGVPQLLNYQGRVSVGGVNFTGPGQFKFAFVDASGTTTYWSNDGTSIAGNPPTAAVNVAVNGGLYAVLLGDTTLPNMTAVSPAVFAHAHVNLRVWFNDGTNGFQLLSPDQRLAAVGYALMAADVADGSITEAKLAPGSVGAGTLANTGVTAGTYTLATIAVDAQGRITSASSNSTLPTRVTALETTVTGLSAQNASFVTASALNAALAGYAQAGADNTFTGANTFANAQGSFSGQIKVGANSNAPIPANAGSLRYESAGGTLAFSNGTDWRTLPVTGVRSISSTVANGATLALVATTTPGSSPLPVLTVWVTVNASTVRVGTTDRNGSGDPSYPITYNPQTGTATVTNNSGTTQTLQLTAWVQ